MSPAISPGCHRAAVIMPSWVGDAVMATPVLRALRAYLPRARLCGVMRPGLDDLLAGAPWLDDTIVEPFKSFRAAWRTGTRLRAFSPQAVLILPNSFRSAAISRISSAQTRVGYARDGRRTLLTHAADLQRTAQPVPAIEYYARLAEFALGRAVENRQLELTVTGEQEQSARALLGELQNPLIVINPGANKAAKRWPAERFAAVVDALADQQHFTIAVTGAPTEREVVRAVIDAMTIPAVDLCAVGVTLGSLKAVLQQAALLISNDTGPRHIAAAVGTPTVSLFGPTDPRWTTNTSAAERCLAAEPFLTEEEVADRQPDRCAIERITVGDVVEAAEQLLGESASTAVGTN